MEGSGGSSESEARSEALRLSEVSQLLGVSSRQIQYLRERGTVVPSQGGSGRGKASRYTPDDVRQLRLILGLKGLDESIIQRISREVDWTQGEYTHHLSRAVQIVIDLTKYRG